MPRWTPDFARILSTTQNESCIDIKNATRGFVLHVRYPGASGEQVRHNAPITEPLPKHLGNVPGKCFNDFMRAYVLAW